METLLLAPVVTRRDEWLPPVSVLTCLLGHPQGGSPGPGQEPLLLLHHGEVVVRLRAQVPVPPGEKTLVLGPSGGEEGERDEP